jgi:hypothetical protein
MEYETETILTCSYRQFFYCFYIWAAQLSKEYSFWMSPSPSGLKVLRSLSALSSVSLNFTRDAEGPGDCGSGVFIAAEVDGVGEQGSVDITMVDVETPLEAFFAGLTDFKLFS